MAIDINKMKAKLAALENKKGGDKKKSFWKPEEGVEHTIRIVNNPDGDPFRELWFHYDINKNSVVCPKKNFKEDCPICAFASKLYNENTEESRNMGKNFLPKQRFFSSVVVRGQEKEGVKVWGYGKTVYGDLINLVLNPDFGDITDPDEGFDIKVKSAKAPGKTLPDTKITPRIKSSKLCNGPAEECAELLDSVPEFSTVFERKSFEEISKMLDEHLAHDNDADAEQASTQNTKYGGTQKAKSATSAIDDAFAELTS
jgi:gp32 DNA binding protein like